MNVETAGELLNLSENIHQLRKRRGWSQQKLADKLNVPRPAVTRWEQPITAMNLNSLEKIADVFGVNIQDLFMLPRVNYTPTKITRARFEANNG